MTRTAEQAITAPPPLRGAEFGTFTFDSIVRRLPAIGHRTLAENDFTPEAKAALTRLIYEIPLGLIRPIGEDGGPDVADWKDYAAPYLGENWLRAPWFFVEMYFYRRVIEASGYFADGPGKGRDPFIGQKQHGLEAPREAVQSLAGRLAAWLAGGWQSGAAAEVLLTALWGNQLDLSRWSGDVAKSKTAAQGQGIDHLLVDDTAAVTAYLDSLSRPARVDVLADNAGFELVGDLTLVDYLLTTGVASQVVMHVKAYPTFVSDAIIADVEATLSWLADDSADATAALGRRLEDHLTEGRLQLVSDVYWNSPRPMWDLPDALAEELAHSDLVISKGDANYRRLLGDRHWPPTTPFTEVAGAIPAPLLALRTCKAELILGLAPGQAAAVAAQDPRWLVDGNWAVAQFSPRS